MCNYIYENIRKLKFKINSIFLIIYETIRILSSFLDLYFFIKKYL